MEQTIKIPVDADNVIISEDTKSILKNLFSGCRVSFLLGAGFSANLLDTLSNNEVVFEALHRYQAKSEDERKKVTILSAFLYWSFFTRCIEPISSKVSTYDPSFAPYKKFGILCTGFLPKEEIQHWIDSSTSLQQITIQ